MITVKDLIEKLQTVDPELVVLVPGYEGGFREVVFSNHVIKFQKDRNEEWYYGPHEEILDGRPEDFKGIVL
jgi:hypothetical protein